MKYILFDLDDTLFDFRRAERLAIRETLVHYGAEADDERISAYHELNDRCWKKLEQGLLSRSDLKHVRFREFFELCGITADPDEGNTFYESRLAQHGELIPHAKNVLRALSQRYTLCVISNGTAKNQYSRLRISGIGQYFTHIFISEEMGVSKPDPAYFTYISERIPDMNRDNTILIGDSLTSDIRGGLNAGLTTVWYNPDGLPLSGVAPARIISSLEEIENLPFL